MENLEQFKAFTATIEELLGNGKELQLIDNLEQIVHEAERVFRDEQKQFQSEISRLNQKLESTEQRLQANSTKENYQARRAELDQQHQQALRNIATLQEQRLQVQQQINSVKRSSALQAQKERLVQLTQENELVDQTLKLYLNVFSKLNWDYDHRGTKGYISQQNGAPHPFHFEHDAHPVEVADHLWDLLAC